MRDPQRRTTADRGSALVIVLGAMMVLTLVVTAAMTFAVQVNSAARKSTDWNQAFAAAEAGVDDYLARLNANDSYWLQSPDCTNNAMQRPYGGSSPKCGWGASTPVGWLNVPGSPRAQFHYDADISATYIDGTIDLTATGRVGDETRTIVVTLRKGGFGEFLYYTVYETVDPANEAVYGINNTTAEDQCSHYFWEPRTATSKPRAAPPACSDIVFTSGDKINGPLHSNDALLFSGTPWFQGTVSTSWPQCRPSAGGVTRATNCYRVSGSASPRLDKSIAYREEIELPSSLGDLRKYVDPAQTTRPGCMYTGPTRIKFNDTGAAVSTMTVWSPWSRSLNPGCGDPTRSWPQTLTVPTNNLIYVRDVPATQSTPATGQCSPGSIGDGFPQANDFNQTLREFDCRYGTVYIQGTLKGRVTVSAENNILITGNLTYSGGKNGSDVLGLVATNSVKVYHPINRTCTATSKGKCTAYSYTNMALPSGAAFSNPQVYASILTLQHSFTVSSYQYGSPLGTLTLFGSFAQRFRGPVGTSSGGNPVTGYLKNYEYDTRLRYSPPPYFLDPVHSSWGVKTFGEVAALYR